MDIRIDPEFRDYLGPLDPDARQALEASLKQEGCRDGLVIWRQDENTAILLDGHNRHELCTQFDIPYWTILCPETVVDRESALAWIVENQRGRRNLTLERFKYLTGKVYQARKSVQGGTGINQHNMQSGKICHSAESGKTADRLAQEFGVSPRTVRNNAAFAEQVDAVAAQHGHEAKAEILSGRKKVADFVEADEAAKATLRVEPDIKSGNHVPIPEFQTAPEMIPGESPPAPAPPKVSRGNIEAGVLLMDGLSTILQKINELAEAGLPDQKTLPAILQSIGEAESQLRELSRALTKGAQ